MKLERGLLLWKTIASVLISAADAGDFLAPWAAGPNKDYTFNRQVMVGTSMFVQWRLNGDGRSKLRLWQDYRPGGPFGGLSAEIEDDIQGSVYNWTVSSGGFDVSFNNVYYLEIKNDVDIATTHYFNITIKEPAGSSTSTLAPISSPAPTETVWQTAVVNYGTSDKPLPTGTLIGIVVGVVAVLICLLAGAWWAFRIWKKNKEDTGRDLANGNSHSAGGNAGRDGNNQNKYAHGNEIGGNPLNEADGTYVPPLYEADVRQAQPRRFELASS
ncbi:hypothetical protein PG993_013143 [Apiospora rasikravindrae]|uniref:Uncharacterized protein n=1 Tax=Apiospora rasikravindrae TaxID=990691 RepID=A0ABR1RWS9_9PEZI